MSLVSTASDSSSRSCLHSAATSAVLPEPTGPPTPMRSGSPGCRARRGRSVWACGCAVEEMRWHGMAFLSGRRTAVGRVRCGAGPARRAAGRTGRRAPWRPRRRSARTAPTARTSAPRRRRDPVPAAAAPRSPNRSSSCRRRTARLLGGQTAGRDRPRRRPPRGAVSRPSASQSRAARPGGPAAPARGPGPATPAARPAPVCARRFRRRAAAHRQVPACTAAAIDAVTRPVGPDPAAQVRPQRARGRRPGRWSPPPRCRRSARGHRSAAANRPGRAGWSGVRHQNRKYRCAMGSSVAGCSCQTSPSMRTVKVSGSTSMRGWRR